MFTLGVAVILASASAALAAGALAATKINITALGRNVYTKVYSPPAPISAPTLIPSN
jgi:hypothetical protein